MTREEMTPVAEKVYITLAKAHVRNAAWTLYQIYEKDIMKAHLYSGVGFKPKQFGYNYNVAGESYQDRKGTLGLIFYKAIMDYSFEDASKTAELPFLSYVLSIIGLRAQDSVRSEQRHKSRFVPYSVIGKKARENNSYDNDLDAVEAAAIRDGMFDSEKSEKAQKILEDTVNEMLEDLKDKDTDSYNYAKACYNVAKEHPKGKMPMAEVAEKFGNMRGTKKCQRSNMYHYRHTTLVNISKKAERNFHLALGLLD